MIQPSALSFRDRLSLKQENRADYEYLYAAGSLGPVWVRLMHDASARLARASSARPYREGSNVPPAGHNPKGSGFTSNLFDTFERLGYKQRLDAPSPTSQAHNDQWQGHPHHSIRVATSTAATQSNSNPFHVSAATAPAYGGGGASSSSSSNPFSAAARPFTAGPACPDARGGGGRGGGGGGYVLQGNYAFVNSSNGLRTSTAYAGLGGTAGTSYTSYPVGSGLGDGTEAGCGYASRPTVRPQTAPARGRHGPVPFPSSAVLANQRRKKHAEAIYMRPEQTRVDPGSFRPSRDVFGYGERRN